MRSAAFFLLLFITGLASCQKDLSIPIPEEPVKPTLNAFMNQDSIVIARVTLTTNAGYDTTGGNPGAIQPDNVVVKLFEDGNYIESLRDTTLPFAGRYFAGNKKVLKGHSYKLTAEVPGYDMVEGSDIIPDRNNLTIEDTTVFATATEFDYQNGNFRFTVTNSGTMACNYRFRMFAQNPQYSVTNTGDTILTNYMNALSCKIKSTDFSNFGLGDTYVDPRLGGIYSNAGLPPGDSRSYTLEVENYYSSDHHYSFAVLEVTVLSNDSYNYLYTFNNTLKNSDDPTSEKQNVICNVKKGFGIVGGMAIQNIIFKN